MLDLMRKHSRSFIIYVFLGIIIAVFVINFGPQASGCAPGVTSAGSIAGRTVATGDINYALSMSQAARRSDATSEQLARIRAAMIDKLVVRELLAEDALARGIRVSEEDVREMLLDGTFLALGQRRPVMRNDEGAIDYDLLSRYARYAWGISVKKFREQQQRELLAERLRRVIAAGVQVSEDEVQAEYMNDAEKVNLTYLRFTPAAFRDQVRITPEEREAFAKKNAERIKKYYADNAQNFEKLPPQVRVEILQVNVTGEGEAARAAARARAEALRARLAAGEAYDALVKEADPPSIGPAGPMGWRSERSLDVYPKAKAAILALAPGAISPVLEDGSRFLVARMVAKRKGGKLDLAAATAEIADELLRDERAKALAKKAAEAALARLKAGAKIADIEKKPLAPGAPPLPAAEETGPFSRNASHAIPGIGASKALMRDAFALEVGAAGKRVYDTGAAFVVVEVKAHDRPKPDAWAKERDQVLARFLARKRAEVIARYEVRRCREAAEAGDVRINAAVALVTPGFRPEPGKPMPTYHPCASLGLGPLAAMGGLPFALPGGGAAP